MTLCSVLEEVESVMKESHAADRDVFNPITGQATTQRSLGFCAGKAPAGSGFECQGICRVGRHLVFDGSELVPTPRLPELLRSSFLAGFCGVEHPTKRPQSENRHFSQQRDIREHASIASARFANPPRSVGHEKLGKLLRCVRVFQPKRKGMFAMAQPFFSLLHKTEALESAFHSGI